MTNEKIFLKELTVGPMIYDDYTKYKLKEFKDVYEGYFFLDKLTDLSYNIHEITESIKYFLCNNKIHIETHISFSNKILKCAAARTFTISKSDKNRNASTKSDMYYFITPVDKDIDEYRKIQLKKYAKYEENFKYKLYSNNIEVDFDGKKIIHKNKTGFNEQLSDITSKIDSNNKNSKFKLFKPKASILKYLNKASTENSDSPKSMKSIKYKPPGLSKNAETNTSLVIKNIPTNFEYGVIYNELKKMFNKFGLINRIKLLKNDRDELTGIGFIDCIDAKTMNKILNCKMRFCIHHCILSIERSKNKKPR